MGAMQCHDIFLNCTLMDYCTDCSSSVLITILITHTHSPQISVTMTYCIPLQSSLNKHLINHQTWSGCCGMSVLSKSITALCCFPKKRNGSDVCAEHTGLSCINYVHLMEIWALSDSLSLQLLDTTLPLMLLLDVHEIG